MANDDTTTKEPGTADPGAVKARKDLKREAEEILKRETAEAAEKAAEAAEKAAEGAEKAAEAADAEKAEETTGAEKAEERAAAARFTLGPGAFIIKTHKTHPDEIKDPEEFNISPRDDIADPIPEEQREIDHGIYEVWGVLKALRDQGVFQNDRKTFYEFRGRLLQAAHAGLAANHVRTRLAAKALEQIRTEISLRKGITIKLNYLGRLALWAVLGVVVGVVLVRLSVPGQLPPVPELAKPVMLALKGYGWVIIGAMAGAWMSVAATRRTVAFEEMPNFLRSRAEPCIRLVFVALLAVALALLLQEGVLTLKMGTVDFAEFPDKTRVALLLGLVAGISEKAVSVRVMERVRKVFTPGTT